MSLTLTDDQGAVPMPDTTTTILRDPAGRPLDLAALLASANRWTWMRLGVHANGRDWLCGPDYARHHLPGRYRAGLVVRLAADDTYSLEIGRTTRALDWKVLAQMRGVHIGQLAAALDALYLAAFDG